MKDIIQHMKNLTDESLYDDSFAWLVTCFFDDLLIDNLSNMEKFQVFVSILLSVMKRLKKAEKYEDMRALCEVHHILYTKIYRTHRKHHRVELMITDQYYQQQFHNILKSK